MIKRIPQNYSLLAILIMILNLISCDKTKTGKEPSPNIEKLEYNLIYKSTSIVDFMQIENKDNIINIDTDEAGSHFGERIKYATPKELLFIDDSVIIVMNGDIERKYKFKCESAKMFIYCEISENWEYCAKKNTDSELIFNIGLFIQNQNNTNRTLKVIAQSNSTKSHTELLDKNDLVSSSSITWLRAEVLFQQE